MKRKRANQFVNVLLAFVLIFGLLATSTGSALAKKDKPARMDPDFLKLGAGVSRGDVQGHGAKGSQEQRS